jgi:hypothetical protein
MENRLIYITNPANLVSFVIFIFWLWVTWSNLNWRIKKLEEETEKIDATKIEAKLAEIATDLQRIKAELNKRN